MKIITLQAENIKKLKAIEITPTGELVEITGKNGAGKTSVLDAIFWALAGTKNIQAAPIRKGADKARIKVTLGADQVELIVERRFTEAGSTLVVESPQGARFKSPQAMLDALLGALAFDPLAFVNEEPRQQFETLRRLVPLEIDVDQLDGLNLRDYEERTRINRDAKAARAQADGIAVPSGLPEQPIDTSALMDRMASASKTNAEIETRRGRREAAAAEATTLRARAAEERASAQELRERAARMEQVATELTGKAEDIDRKLASAEALPEPVDVDAIRTELEAAQETNRKIELRGRRDLYLANAIDLERQSRELTDAMEARAKVKAEAIAKAPMPVEGLSFGDGIVTYDGVPFEQAETSAQIRVGVAIAMAANPKLRVIRIKEGSFLDTDNLALIAQMAKERDYQVWIERVDTSGKVGVVIEDGMVAAVNGEPAPAA